jgi:hypothetical protein
MKSPPKKKGAVSKERFIQFSPTYVGAHALAQNCQDKAVRPYEWGGNLYSFLFCIAPCFKDIGTNKKLTGVIHHAVDCV